MERLFILLFLLSSYAMSIQAQYYRASPLRMTITEQVAYELYQAEIDSAVNFSGREKYYELRQTYKIPHDKISDLARYVALRERRRLTYDYIYPDDAEKRYAAKKRVDTQFQDSIDAILLLRNDLSGYYTSRILTAPPGRFITEAQYDSLMVRALAMCREKRADPSIDLHDEDIAAMQAVLPDKEVSRYIRLFNNTEINRQLDEVWQKIKDYDLTQRYDSARACAQIYHYLQKEMVVKVIFKNKPDLQKQALRALAPERPEAYRMYKSLLLREDIEKKKQKENESKDRMSIF